VDGTSALQFNWGFADAVPSLKMRLGQGAAWLAWQTLPSVSATSANLTPGTGFDVPATEIARASRVGDVVMLDGYIQPTGAPATLTAGQVVGTVPAGYRPSVTDWGADLQVYDASATPTMETIKAKIAIDGTITTRTASTYQADRLYFKTAYRGA
jgi:hypothetical protein